MVALLVSLLWVGFLCFGFHAVWFSLCLVWFGFLVAGVFLLVAVPEKDGGKRDCEADHDDGLNDGVGVGWFHGGG